MLARMQEVFVMRMVIAGVGSHSKQQQEQAPEERCGREGKRISC